MVLAIEMGPYLLLSTLLSQLSPSTQQCPLWESISILSEWTRYKKKKFYQACESGFALIRTGSGLIWASDYDQDSGVKIWLKFWKKVELNIFKKNFLHFFVFHSWQENVYKSYKNQGYCNFKYCLKKRLSEPRNQESGPKLVLKNAGSGSAISAYTARGSSKPFSDLGVRWAAMDYFDRFLRIF